MRRGLSGGGGWREGIESKLALPGFGMVYFPVERTRSISD